MKGRRHRRRAHGPTRIGLRLGAVLLLAAGAFPGPTPAAAEELSGEFSLGWRFVDVDGAESKYRQHVNLREGARVFGIGLRFRPDSELVDLVEVRADSLGGEPYESFEIGIRRFDAYRFSFGRRVSETFYEDLLLPPGEADPRVSNGGDFHHFDFERVRDFATFSADLSERTSLDVSFDRFSREGDSTTVLDIQRDEFELEQPVDETLDQITAAFRIRWDRASLLVRESYRSYENAREIFLPGFSEGENPGPAVLDLYFLDQPTDSSSIRHSAVLRGRPHEDVRLSLSVLYDETDLDVGVSERGQGLGFNGSAFTVDREGGATLERSVGRIELDGSWRITERLALLGAVRRRDLSQEGALDFAGDEPRTAWDLANTGFELGVELALRSGLHVAAGVLQESREVEEPSVEGASGREEIDTDHTGLWARVDWSPSRRLQVRARFENAGVDDPYTLSSATDRDRISLRVRWQSEGGLFAQVQALHQDVENRDVGSGGSSWEADLDSATLRFGYRREGFQASVGYSRIDVDRSIDQLVATGGFGAGDPFLFPVRFDSEADFADVSVSWKPLERLRLGADLRRFENDGDFAMDRDDFRLSAEVLFTERYLARLSVRSIEYAELERGLNDYEAELVELAVGYRF